MTAGQSQGPSGTGLAQYPEWHDLIVLAMTGSMSATVLHSLAD